MSHRCSACSVKRYDKAWKLRRHIRESKKCFEKINPSESAIKLIRFQCTSCAYTSQRELDLKRHRQRVHGEIALTAASSHASTNTSREGSTRVSTTATPDLQQLASSSAHQDRHLQSAMKDVRLNEDEHLGSSSSTGTTKPSSLHSTPCIQMVTQPVAHEDLDEVERTKSHLNSRLRTSVTKRKYSDHDCLSTGCKRVCTQVAPRFLDVPHGFGAWATPTEEINSSTEQDSERKSVTDALSRIDAEFRTLSFDPQTFNAELLDVSDLLAGFDMSWTYSATYDGYPVPPFGTDPSIVDPVVCTSFSKNLDRDDASSRDDDPSPKFTLWGTEVLANPGILANNNSTSTVENHEVSSALVDSAKGALSKLEKDDYAISSDKYHAPLFARVVLRDPVPTLSMLNNIAKKRQSTSSSSVGIPQSTSTSRSSKGSLFGRPSTHVYEPWMTWSSGSSLPVTTNSLHSASIPGPMLGSVDKELTLSRAIYFQEDPHAMDLAGFHEPNLLHEQFREAARDGKVSRMRSLVVNLDFDCNNRGTYECGETPLIWAAHCGYERAVKVLIADSCGEIYPNAQDMHGMTAMWHACFRGDLAIVDALLRLRGIDIKLSDENGYTALMIAIMKNHRAVVDRLIASAKVGPNHLTTAAEWSRFISARDLEGRTAFHLAVKMKCRHILKALLDTGSVDVNLKVYGMTAAMHAVDDVSPGTLAFLLEHKACDHTLTNDHGETVLQLAQRVSGRAEVLLRRVRLFRKDYDEIPLQMRILRLVEDYVVDASQSLQNRALESP